MNDDVPQQATRLTSRSRFPLAPGATRVTLHTTHTDTALGKRARRRPGSVHGAGQSTVGPGDEYHLIWYDDLNPGVVGYLARQIREGSLSTPLRASDWSASMGTDNLPAGSERGQKGGLRNQEVWSMVFIDTS